VALSPRSLRSLRPSPDPKRDGGLAVVGLLALVIGFGSLAAVVIFVALAWLWWGRSLGMAALFALAITVAACLNAHRTAAAPKAAASIAAARANSG
jgi:hypothetical protein